MKTVLPYLVLAVLIALLIIFLGKPSSAHEWFPYQCCHGRDCSLEANPVRVSSNGDLEIQSHLDSLWYKVEDAANKYPSQDSDYHGCWSYSGYFRCVMIPPES